MAFCGHTGEAEAEAEASYVAGFPVPLPLGAASVLHAASPLRRAPGFGLVALFLQPQAR